MESSKNFKILSFFWTLGFSAILIQVIVNNNIAKKKANATQEYNKEMKEKINQKQ